MLSAIAEQLFLFLGEKNKARIMMRPCSRSIVSLLGRRRCTLNVERAWRSIQPALQAAFTPFHCRVLQYCSSKIHTLTRRVGWFVRAGQLEAASLSVGEPSPPTLPARQCVQADCRFE